MTKAFTTTRTLLFSVGILSTIVLVQFSSHRALHQRVMDLETRMRDLQNTLAQMGMNER